MSAQRYFNLEVHTMYVAIQIWPRSNKPRITFSMFKMVYSCHRKSIILFDQTVSWKPGAGSIIALSWFQVDSVCILILTHCYVQFAIDIFEGSFKEAFGDLQIAKTLSSTQYFVCFQRIPLMTLAQILKALVAGETLEVWIYFVQTEWLLFAIKLWNNVVNMIMH